MKQGTLKMKTVKELTPERLKSLLNYNPETGEFTWLVNRRRDLVGKIAGCSKHAGGGKFYTYVKIDGKQYYAHRLAWLYTFGAWPENQIDHVNQDSLNNRLSNLRDVTGSENLNNQKMSKNNLSGVTGVIFRNKSQKWEACIRVNGKLIHLGLFNLKADAIVARKNAEVKYNFHPNHGG